MLTIILMVMNTLLTCIVAERKTYVNSPILSNTFDHLNRFKYKINQDNTEENIIFQFNFTFKVSMHEIEPQENDEAYHMLHVYFIRSQSLPLRDMLQHHSLCCSKDGIIICNNYFGVHENDLNLSDYSVFHWELNLKKSSSDELKVNGVLNSSAIGTSGFYFSLITVCQNVMTINTSQVVVDGDIQFTNDDGSEYSDDITMLFQMYCFKIIFSITFYAAAVLYWKYIYFNFKLVCSNHYYVLLLRILSCVIISASLIIPNTNTMPIQLWTFCMNFFIYILIIKQLSSLIEGINIFKSDISFKSRFLYVFHFAFCAIIFPYPIEQIILIKILLFLFFIVALYFYISNQLKSLLGLLVDLHLGDKNLPNFTISLHLANPKHLYSIFRKLQMVLFVNLSSIVLTCVMNCFLCLIDDESSLFEQLELSSELIKLGCLLCYVVGMSLVYRELYIERKGEDIECNSDAKCETELAEGEDEEEEEYYTE